MTNDSALPYRLRLPGPTAVPERVRQAIAQPVIAHRGPEFHALARRAETLLQPILGTKNRVLFFASSGTGMMEASLANIVAPGEKLLVVAHGAFGERFATIGRLMGADVDALEVPWGEEADPSALEARLRANDYRALVVVQNESSTGVVTDLAALGGLTRERATLLVVDSVSGLAGIPMRQDAWGADVVVSASQKALMCPPGLGLASVSDKAWKVIERETKTPRFYWDFRRARAAAEKFETSFTAPVAMIAGLVEALEMIDAEGIGNVLARHRLLSGALRAGGAALGLDDFTRSAVHSATVVVFTPPKGCEADAIVRELYARYRTVIAGARNKLSGRVIRIGTMGAIDVGTILTDLMQLEDVLARLGAGKKPGTGVAAALAWLAARNGAPPSGRSTKVA